VLALAAAGYLHVLRDLFTKVTIPYEVVQEIEAGGRTQFARDEFRTSSWMDKRSVSVSVSPRRRFPSGGAPRPRWLSFRFLYTDHLPH
jgi:hypothetical protein